MKLSCLFPCCALLGLLGCSPPRFHTEVSGQATIPGDPSPLAGLLASFPSMAGFTNIDFSQDQEFKNQGITKDQVRSVKATSVTLSITDPADADFSFLESIEFYARSGDQQVLVAEQADVGALGLKAPHPVLTLQLKDAELQPYVTAPSMSIVVQGRGRPPRSDVHLQAKVGLEITVNAF